MAVNAPLVSVVMITYNHEKYIAEAIQSVLDQTFTDFEFVIVNDGSIDRTDEIIKSFQNERIIYIYQDNQGPSAATNNGILAAKGKYIALMSGDDVCYPQRLEKQYQYLNTTDTKILFSWVDFIDDDSQPLLGEHFAKNYFNHSNRTQSEILNWFLTKGNYLCAVSAFIEREILLEVGLFNLSSIQQQDFDMWIKLIKKYNFFIAKEKLIKYRIRQNESNLSHPYNFVRSTFEGYQIYKSILDDVPINLFKEAFKNNIKNLYFEEGVEYELEKAFLYLNHSSHLIQSIGGEKLFNLLQDKTVLSIAKGKYNFGLPELYQLTKDMDITNSRLVQHTQTELERSLQQEKLTHSQLQHTQTELERSLQQEKLTHSQLQHTQTELERSLQQEKLTHSQLQHTQTELELTHSQLQHTQTELELTHSQLQHTQTELERSLQQEKLTHSQLQHTQTELERSLQQEKLTHSQLQYTQTELERSHSQFHKTQAKLQRLQVAIIAMQTSKFWKLRTSWFKFKKALRLTDTDKELISTIQQDLIASPLDLPTQPTTYIVPAQTNNNKQVLAQLYLKTLKSFLYSGFKLEFTIYQQPLVTVILVLYNRGELTFQCLRSLRENFDVPIEIIIVDNASSDETSLLLDRLEGIKIIRNAENLHFLLASNQAAKQAKGKYILFLNNDAQVLPGSITSAVKTIESSDDIGAVGGKIILLDGSLQEAGSIIWKDGSCLGYGRGDSPFAPMYMFMRDVDYCSGAFLLTSRELFLQMGGFDTDYKPAYYEETDYCLRLWKMGKRVVYDPDAVILHFEFASSKSSESALQLQAERRAIFLNKHSEKLQFHYQSDPSNLLLARSINKQSRRVLFLDDRVPHSFLGSGYPRAKEILLGLLKLGCFVTFYPLTVHEEDWESVYQDNPKNIEVMIGYGSTNLEEFLRQRQGYYDTIIISRPHNMQIFQPIFTINPEWFTKTKIVYDAEALFSLREVAQRKLNGEKVSQSQIENLVNNELKLAKGVNSIISVSQNETNKFIEFGFEQVYTLGHTVPIKITDNNFEKRSDILFVGAIHEDSSPNADAVYWFVKNIFPSIQKNLNDENIKFIVVGTNYANRIINLANDQVKVIGKVDDLTDYYNQARIFVAPTRFAAGIPFKVHHAAAHGLPIVSTSLIASQLGWQDDTDLLVADDPSSFAQKCVRLYNDVYLWEKLRANSLNRIKQECSNEAFMTKLKDILVN